MAEKLNVVLEGAPAYWAKAPDAHHLKVHGLPVFITSNVTEDKVIAMDPSYSRLVYLGAPQVVVDPYKAATTGATTVSILNCTNYICCNQSSVVVGSA